MGCAAEFFRGGWARYSCLVLLAILTGLQAQAAELRGQVVDPRQLVVVAAHVRLFPETDGKQTRPLRRALTDAEGQFRFVDLPPGRYRLEVFAAGFQRHLQEVELGEGGQHVEIRLLVAGVHEGVVVTATRQEGETFDTPLPTALVTSQKLDRQLSVNLAQALEEIPGVSWVNAGAFRSRPVIRGLDSNRILVLVDGERLNNSRTSTTDAGIETSLIDFSQVEQVEVVRGPGSVLYGSDAFGGVLNIRTRSVAPIDRLRLGTRLRGETFSNGEAGRFGLELFGSTRWLGVRLSGSAGSVQDYTSPLGRVFGTGVDQSSALGELRFYPSPHRSFFVKFIHQGAYNFGVPDLVADPVFLGLFPFSKLQKFSAGYQANYRSPVLSAIQLRFHYQEQTRDFLSVLRTPFFSLQSETITDVNTFGFDFQATSLAARRHALTYGVTFYRDRNRDTRVQIINPRTSPRVLSREPSVPISALAGTGLFLQDQFELTRRLRLIGGVRLDHFRLSASQTPNYNPLAFSAITQSRQDSAVTGSLAATFEPLAGWIVTAQAARAFREPNLFERYFFGRGPFGGFVVPNPDLRPETSLQFDAGTRIRRGPVRVSFNYFLNNLTDQLVRTRSTFLGMTTIGGEPIFRNINVQKSRIQGVESSGELLFSRWNSQWTPFVTLAWQRGTNRTQDLPLPLIAPFVSHVGVRWQPKQLRAWSEWRVRIAQGSQRVPPDQMPLSGFTVHAWRAGYETLRGEHGLGTLLPRGVAAVNFHFTVENFTNHLYRGLFETVPEPGRSFRFGVDFNLDTTAR